MSIEVSGLVRFNFIPMSRSVVRTAFNDWGTIYLIREKGYSHIVAASSVTSRRR